MQQKLRLGVNIDHVATLRNARGGSHPCPVAAAHLAKAAGADSITAHLREDRRHICDADMARLAREVGLPLNFEMAATAEMQAIALDLRPQAVCLVPENRAEKTTEGGLNVVGQQDFLRAYIAPLLAANIRVSLFIDAEEAQIRGAHAVGAPVIEIHTGHYAELCAADALSPTLSRDAGEGEEDSNGNIARELRHIRAAAKLAHTLGLEVHAGHGLSYENTPAIAAIPEIRELNIGHFLVGEAVFVGLDAAIQKMRRVMDEARHA